MPKNQLRTAARILQMCALLVVVLFVNGTAAPPAAADTQDIPTWFVHDSVGSLTLKGTTLFWKTNCGDDLSPARSRLRSTNTRGSGGVGSTLYFPSACQADRVASANVAVDNTNAYWITGDGRLVRLARTATAGTAPTLVLHTGLSSVSGFPGCCWVAVDNTYLYWNENRVIKRAPKTGGAAQTMFTATADVRDLKPRGDNALFYREGRRLRILVPFGTGFAFISISDGVNDYTLNDSRVLWVTAGTNGYLVQSKTRDTLADLQTHYTSPATAGLHADTITADNTNVYWHQVLGTGGGPIFKKALSGGSDQTLTSNLTMGSYLVNDGLYLLWLDYNTGIYRLPVTPSAPVTGDIWITGVEVTQGIQTYDAQRNEIPLIGNKLTAVRVYVQSITDAAGPWNNVTATLTVSGGGGVYTPLNHYTITVPTTGSDRRTLNDSFAFVLNPGATAPGSRNLQIEIHSTTGRPEANLSNNQTVQPVAFGAPQSLTIYGFTYANMNNGVTCTNSAPNDVTPPFSAYEVHRQFAENVYPLSTFSIIRLPGDPQQSFDNSDCLGYQRAHTWFAGQIDHLPAGSIVRGHLLTPEDTTGGWCCTGAASKVSRGGNSSVYPGYTLSQEQGHATFPCPMCNCHTFDPCFGYPWTDNSIGPQVGVKIRPSLEARPGRDAGGNFVYGDFMSYSPPPWVSPYTYCSLMPLLSASALNCPTGVASRLPPGDINSNATPAGTGGGGTYLYVSGWFSPNDVAEFAPFDQVTSNKDLTTPDKGKNYSLTLEDSGEKALATYLFDATQDLHPNDSPSTLFGAYLPWVPGTDTIALRHNGKLLLARKVTPNAPVVKFDAPTGGGVLKGKVKLEWHASDQDGDLLTYNVYYSNDNGKTWLPLQRDLKDTSLVVNFKNVPGGGKVRLRIAATDGVNTSDVISPDTYTVALKKPTITVSGIKDGATFGRNERFLLGASAFDWEDGAITAPKQFEWSSDLDGALGSGPWIVPTLTPGKHTLSVRVTDSDGMSKTKKIHVTVRKN